MVEHEFPYESFIGGWYIPETICDNLIAYYKGNQNLVKQGITSGGLNLKTKDSLDISISVEDFKNDEVLNEYALKLIEVLQLYQKKYTWVKENALFDLTETSTIQYYKPGGGFKKWHFERADLKLSSRLLTFMTYLNTVEDGGTDFYYQKISSPAKKGLTLIWPTDWTHTHKGQISNREKYIITGWFNFIK